MYRVRLEAIPGIRVHVDNPSGVNRGVKQVMLDGKRLPGIDIPLLSDGGQHKINIIMG